MTGLKKNVILLLVCFNIAATAQETSELFPMDLNFQPFAANTLEPKLGFLFHLDDNVLRLDVGNSMDIYKVNYSGNSSLSIGADLFTFSRLRSEDDFKFPVEAIDYLFGLNAAYVAGFNESEIGIRLRLSHISAHLVDGRYQKNTNTWIDNKLPFVFSKEFIELMGYYRVYDIRLYGGITYNYNIAPGLLGADQFQLGFDYFNKTLLGDSLSPFVGYDYRLANLDEYTSNHNIVAGLKIGKHSSKGFSLFINYYSGRSFHGELYDQTVTYTALGMNFDL